MKSSAFLVPIVVLLFLCVSIPSEGSNSPGGSWRKFAGCLRQKLGIRSVLNMKMVCAAKQMFFSFRKMQSVGCKNCDKYFHCQANYNAVQKCSRHQDAVRAAEAISNCREFSQGGTDADSQADQVANRHGRSGGSCSKYLCGVNCKYNPKDGSCKKSNC